jgi:hypothetical protein
MRSAAFRGDIAQHRIQRAKGGEDCFLGWRRRKRELTDRKPAGPNCTKQLSTRANAHYRVRARGPIRMRTSRAGQTLTLSHARQTTKRLCVLVGGVLRLRLQGLGVAKQDPRRNRASTFLWSGVVALAGAGCVTRAA